MSMKVVALVGRPNVGKSTLFNRIAGQRVAVVSDVPGVTRDRVSVDAQWSGRRFILVDTGGITVDSNEPLWDDIRGQTEQAIRHADAVVLVTDAEAGITAADSDAADLVRKLGKTAVVAANKCETRVRRQASAEFHQLGMQEVYPVAALHGIGVDDLLKGVMGDEPNWEHGNQPDNSIKVAIVGKPNTGKSRLLNAMVGDERAIVSDVAGTTRDTVDSIISRDGRDYTILDTAGIRRRGKIKVGIEQYSVLRTLYAIERADVCLVVLSVDDLMTAQDQHIAGYVKDAARAAVVVVNKWDLAKQHHLSKEGVAESIDINLNFLTGPRLVFTSAIAGSGVDQVLEAVNSTYANYTTTLPEYELNKVLAEAVGTRLPPTRKGKRPVILRATQEASAPPVFVIGAKHPENLHFSYRRYLENRLRDSFDLAGSPIVLRFVPTKG